ncbi:hypothetical protein TRFO_07317 [Tritrichomonas foetus]|uniref:KATNIP domain-containing protein n=1 Tax=Tritrichomonas foetus TaxID=1144522 RepID=A0A1J4JTP0_9EUKA|nr:hypothetical protein TRFO_07317 [Tritrichomonas foetus]|eukprot:OHT02114.1 hypothetical protein TRFO_07317 [Tritrichomonas foetus]
MKPVANLRSSKNLAKIIVKRPTIHANKSYAVLEKLPQPNHNVSSSTGSKKGSIAPSFSFRDFQKCLPHAQSRQHQRSKGVSHVGSQLSFLSQSLLHTKVLTIQIQSNWGNQTTMMLSAINVYDEKHNQIIIKSISSYPELPNPVVLERLTLTNLIKNEKDEFQTEWPPQYPYDSFSFIITIDDCTTPKYIRLWNSQTSQDAAAKSFAILHGTNICCEGVIPKGFGNDYELSFKSKNIEESFSKQFLQELFPNSIHEQLKLQDIYGNYPLHPVSKVTFEILNTHCDSKERIIGLNGIELYNENFAKITENYVDEVFVENFLSSTNRANLIRENKVSNKEVDMFMGELFSHESESLPKIHFIMTEPVMLTKIEIWNLNAENRSLRINSGEVM